MDQKQSKRSIVELFGLMTLIVTIVLFTGMARRPDLFKTIRDQMPIQVYLLVGILGLSWVVTVGLGFDRAWARVLACVVVSGLLLVDILMATKQVSAPPGFLAQISITVFRLTALLESGIALWGLTLLYLLLAPRPSAPSPSAISVEVLNTK